MKAYRGLGKVLMGVKPKLSHLYLTKYLIASWKLGEHFSELEAYELIGKYYFYNGDLRQANIYHTRMAQGQHEPLNSVSRRLAIAKLNSGSVGTSQSQFAKYTATSDEQEYVVSSDDETFEFMFSTDSDEVKQEQKRVSQMFQAEKPRQQHFQIRNLPKFDRQEDDRLKHQEFKLANQNIRQQKQELQTVVQKGDEFDVKKLHLSQSRMNVGNLRERILVQHLSPSRTLEVYQGLELTKDSKAYKNSDLLNTVCEKFDIVHVQKIVNKYTIMAKITQEWLEQTYFDLKSESSDKVLQYQRKWRNSQEILTLKTKRKGYFD